MILTRRMVQSREKTSGSMGGSQSRMSRPSVINLPSPAGIGQLFISPQNEKPRATERSGASRTKEAGGCRGRGEASPSTSLMLTTVLSSPWQLSGFGQPHEATRRRGRSQDCGVATAAPCAKCGVLIDCTQASRSAETRNMSQ
jgi:hypothetical protein